MDHFKGNTPHAPLSTTDPSEIRVVNVNLDGSDDQIRCQLEHVSLKDVQPGEGPYVALSYVWGDPNTTVNIMLNGEPFPVTINLFIALIWLRRHRRHQIEANLKKGVIFHGEDQSDADDRLPGSQLTLWIDAICINQTDHSERASQVTRMTDIYTRAERVVGFVGSGEVPADLNTEDSAKLIALNTVVNDAFRLINMIYREDGIYQAEEGFNFWLQQKPELYQPTRDVLLACLLHPFWRRKWTYQEQVVQFDRTLLVCGNQAIYLRYLHQLAESLFKEAFERRNDLMTAIKISDVLFHWNAGKDIQGVQCTSEADKGQRLLRLLRNTAACEATEARDRLYSLLGLLGGEIPSTLMPSYDKPLQEIYFDYAKWLLKHTGDLTIIECEARFDESTGPSWTSVPSWVVNLSHLSLNNGFRRDELTPRTLTKSLGFKGFSENGRTIRVEGFRVGVVKTVYKAMPSTRLEEVSHKDLLEWLKCFETCIVQKVCATRPAAPRDDVLYNLFVAVQKGDGIVACREEYEKAINGQSLTNEGVQKFDVSPLGQLWNKDWLLVDQLGLDVWTYLRFKEQAAEGDVVWLLKGCQYASILRTDRETHKFLRVGGCNNYETLNATRAFMAEDEEFLKFTEIEIS